MPDVTVAFKDGTRRTFKDARWSWNSRRVAVRQESGVIVELAFDTVDSVRTTPERGNPCRP